MSFIDAFIVKTMKVLLYSAMFVGTGLVYLQFALFMILLLGLVSGVVWLLISWIMV